jgi:guanine deaminase
VHAEAAALALDMLHRQWSVGPVLMNQNCPVYLRNDDAIFTHIDEMAARFGRRVIVTDRFAVAVDSRLRSQASAAAERLGLRTQTHLNEQRSEKALVEQHLYRDAGSYTDVYLRDGLLDHNAILAHCVHMSDAEFAIVAEKAGVIAHCPTSNTLLGSGVMPLDRVTAHGIEWAICTDVGASPTTSLLAEMAQFLKVHAGRSNNASPSHARYRVTLAPAKILSLDDELGRFAAGMPLSYIEIDAGDAAMNALHTADDVIRAALLAGHGTSTLHDEFSALATTGLDAGPAITALEADVRETARDLDHKVLAVTLNGEEIWRRERPAP